MSNSWDDMKKAKEDSYFAKKSEEALARIAQKQGEVKLSPITGEPMEQEVIHGIVIDRCKKSGGVWLDAGELEQLLNNVSGVKDSEESPLLNFFRGLASSKK